jgi:transposase
LSRTVESLARATAELEAAREKRDKLIAKAAADGMSRREIAKATRLSHQRIQQIIEEGRR